MRFADIPALPDALGPLLRAADDGRLPHALVLKGKPGTAKLYWALALAQYLLCEQPLDGDSCGKCASCRKTGKAAHPDVHLLLPIIARTDKGRSAITEDYLEVFRTRITSPYLGLKEWGNTLEGDNRQLTIPIEDVRNLKRKLLLKAYEGGQRIIIIWHADRMNLAAANAFLKLLEEPPDQTRILLTLDYGNTLLPTIQSRCQTYMVPAMPESALAAWLQRHSYTSDSARASELAHFAEGSPGVALELNSGSIEGFGASFIDWMRACFKGDMADIVAWADGMAKQGREAQKQFLLLALTMMRKALHARYHSSLAPAFTAAEQTFVSKFSAFLDLEAVEQMCTQMDLSMRALGQNAHAQMEFTALSLQLYSILKAAQRTAAS